jgi:hypothetical protein
MGTGAPLTLPVRPVAKASIPKQCPEEAGAEARCGEGANEEGFLGGNQCGRGRCGVR